MRWLLPLAIIVALSVTLSWAPTSPINEAKAYTQNDQNILLLKGFDPQTQLKYKILTPHKALKEGQSIAGEDGSLAIKSSEFSANTAQPLIYDLQIKNGNETLSFLLRINHQTNEIKASGQGLDKFSNITLSTQSRNIQTTSDWAGLFQEKMRLDDNQVFRLALRGGHAFKLSGNPKSPYIIEVLTAPGGGGPDDSGVNDFTPSSGDISTSDQGRVQGTIDKIKENYVTAYMLMTEQLSVVATMQTLILGQFYDAKLQMEAHRLQQKLKARAVKDYHPSDQMCRIGSFVRSIAKSEEKAAANKFALNEFLMTRYANELNASTSEGFAADVHARLKQYREIYCDPKDNNDGMQFMCDHEQPADGEGDIGGDDVQRINKDIDFVRTMQMPYTLDMDLLGDKTDDSEDVLALARNLYWPIPLKFPTVDGTAVSGAETGFLDARRLMALHNVAHNSYATLAGMKTASSDATDEPGWSFMKAMIKEFGISDEDEINQLVGEKPSYWAQMDIMTKKIYQSPHFYTNLYDKPANVARISVALDAIKLMQMRDHFEANLRREMLTSAMIETELSKQYKESETQLINR